MLPIFARLVIFDELMPAGVPGVLRGLGFAATVLGATLLADRESPDEQAIADNAGLRAPT